ncbi:sporulation-control protein [Croceifilum oryzae]|uniref:Sporulation-control protein n=1 Tax=Croceifilum oryzae TaxID=1553429 RepID=A0AAJ1TLP5_9BACL|nr:sporulation protein [Croceifilum oryzae]MDQ0418832.1 sporulation-control protein [Croceifilum oryzae]
MSIFGKTLASMGIGATKVDTRLEKSSYRQGDFINGAVYIQGGQVEQKVDDIYLYLVVQYHHEGNSAEYVLDEFRITEPFVIGPSESKEIPFEFQLPYDVPVTTSGCPVYLKTGLDIRMAKDPGDVDGIEITPHPLVHQMIQLIEEIGFELRGVTADFEHYYTQQPFVQEYRFNPLLRFQDVVDQIVVVFTPHDHEVDIILKVDRKAVDLMTSMEEALDLDQRMTRFVVTQAEYESGQLARRVESLIVKQIY